MHLKQLSILNFKNCEEVELNFSKNVNCFLGNNGEGKTNILDSIYYLSFCKSFFNQIDSQNIKYNEPFFVIEGKYEGKEKETIYCGLKKNEKKQFKRNKKSYDKLADHIGRIPLVLISPLDILLIIEGSEIRRKFIDGIISQYNKNYLNNLLQYNKALHHRNLLLKSFWLNRSFDAESLDPWDEQLVQYGTEIHQLRKKFIDDFTPIFQKYYSLLSNDQELVRLEYRSQLNDGDFKELLNSYLEKDRANHYSNLGVHKDDLVFKIGDHSLKKYGSQGQQKTYLIALKLAQAELIKGVSKKKPILLLDDIYDKLDAKRTTQLMNLVGSGDFGQIFITDTSIQRIPELFKKEKIDYKAFKVEGGNVNDV